MLGKKFSKQHFEINVFILFPRKQALICHANHPNLHEISMAFFFQSLSTCIGKNKKNVISLSFADFVQNAEVKISRFRKRASWLKFELIINCSLKFL